MEETLISQIDNKEIVFAGLFIAREHEVIKCFVPSGLSDSALVRMNFVWQAAGERETKLLVQDGIAWFTTTGVTKNSLLYEPMRVSTENSNYAVSLGFQTFVKPIAQVHIQVLRLGQGQNEESTGAGASD